MSRSILLILILFFGILLGVLLVGWLVCRLRLRLFSFFSFCYSFFFVVDSIFVRLPSMIKIQINIFVHLESLHTNTLQYCMYKFPSTIYSSIHFFTLNCVRFPLERDTMHTISQTDSLSLSLSRLIYWLIWFPWRDPAFWFIATFITAIAKKQQQDMNDSVNKIWTQATRRKNEKWWWYVFYYYYHLFGCKPNKTNVNENKQI